MWNFRDLQVWKEGKLIAKECYAFCGQFPKEEKYNIISQIQRASLSGPLNIAEGCSRSSTKDFCRFLEIALGSYFELETVIELSKELYSDQVELPNGLILSIQIQERKIQSLRNFLLRK